jgi:hypothetical protein
MTADRVMYEKSDRRVLCPLPAVEAAAWTEAFAADDRSRPAAAALRPPVGGRSAGTRRGAPGSRSVRSPRNVQKLDRPDFAPDLTVACTRSPRALLGDDRPGDCSGGCGEHPVTQGVESGSGTVVEDAEIAAAARWRASLAALQLERAATPRAAAWSRAWDGARCGAPWAPWAAAFRNPTQYAHGPDLSRPGLLLPGSTWGGLLAALGFRAEYRSHPRP